MTKISVTFVDEPITGRQWSFIRALERDFPKFEGTTKFDAIEYISKYIEEFYQVKATHRWLRSCGSMAQNPFEDDDLEFENWDYQDLGEW